MPDSPKEWLSTVRAGHQIECSWREDVEKILQIYSYRGRRIGARGKVDILNPDHMEYNILFANTQVLAAAVYSNPPRPDVRRRFRDKDPAARMVSEILERALSYSIDQPCWESMVEALKLDLLLGGRFIPRVRYEPKFKPAEQTLGPDGEPPEPELAYQTVTVQAWPYADFARSPHTTWEQTEWIAFRHWMQKKGAEEEFNTEFPYQAKGGTYGPRVPKDAAAQQEKSVEVWELWDKKTRRVQWISEEDPSRFLRELNDPLRLSDFYPMPQPLYSIPQVDTLIPVPEFTIYQDLADELQTITDRMNRIQRSIRMRGVYDGSIPELGRLFEAVDTEMLPAESIAKLRQAGGIEGAIWMYDNRPAAEVLSALAAYRDKIIQAIYEITGISDIVRGSSKATETATAQNLKARYGSLRIEPRQKGVERILRDVLRLWAEIMCEHFTAKTLMQMTGVEVPDPMMWEQVIIPTMRNEVMLSYRIDIETDSTIADLTLADQSMLNELLGAVAQFTQTMMPLVQTGAVPPQVAQSLMMAIVRRAKLGPQVEDAIEQMVPQIGADGMPVEQAGAAGGSSNILEQMMAFLQESGILDQLKTIPEVLAGIQQGIATLLEEAKKAPQPVTVNTGPITTPEVPRVPIVKIPVRDAQGMIVQVIETEMLPPGTPLV